MSTRVSDNGLKYVCGRRLYAYINTQKFKGLDSGSLREHPVFSAVVRGREATTGNTSAVGRL